MTRESAKSITLHLLKCDELITLDLDYNEIPGKKLAGMLGLDYLDRPAIRSTNVFLLSKTVNMQVCVPSTVRTMTLRDLSELVGRGIPPGTTHLHSVVVVRI